MKSRKKHILNVLYGTLFAFLVAFVSHYTNRPQGEMFFERVYPLLIMFYGYYAYIYWQSTKE